MVQPKKKENTMPYYIAATSKQSFETALERVQNALADEGFGVLTEIDVRATLKKKLDVDFRNYRILGACNPSFAYKALQAEDKIGTMLPCNIVVQEINHGLVEIAAIDPIASMQAVENPGLQPIAGEVREKLRRVVETASKE
jgi:uncharacterized protein (DUF302 family)